MPHCCAYKCNNQYSNNVNTSYHRLPKDPKIAKTWITNINLDSELPKNMYLCSEHFEERYFDTGHEMRQRLMTPNAKSSRKLVKGAVPTIFPQRNPSITRTSSEQRLERKNQSEVNSLLTLFVTFRPWAQWFFAFLQGKRKERRLSIF